MILEINAENKGMIINNISHTIRIGLSDKRLSSFEIKITNTIKDK